MYVHHINLLPLSIKPHISFVRPFPYCSHLSRDLVELHRDLVVLNRDLVDPSRYLVEHPLAFAVRIGYPLGYGTPPQMRQTNARREPHSQV
jgi:hypothetical protein